MEDKLNSTLSQATEVIKHEVEDSELWSRNADRMSLASGWWWSPACDCLSIQLQMSDLAGFDAAAGHMPAVPVCASMCVCELMQSKIVRNTGITGRSSLSDEMDARLLLRRSNHTHILRLRWRGWTPKGATASLMMHRCTCVKVSVHMHTACTSERAHTQTAAMHSSSQTVHILLGCAPISRINEELSHFTVKQRVGLWGKNGCHLQFLKSAFNNVINFKVMR